MTIRAHQVVSALADPSSGVTYLVTGLSAALEASGVHSHIHSLLPASALVDDHNTSYYETWRHPRSLEISPAMKIGLKAAAVDADIMHFHGLWRMPHVYPAKAVRGTSCELVHSPNGMLEPWALEWSGKRKKVFWHVVQRRAVESARCLHAASQQEASNLRKLGLSQPIAVVPIGVEIPALSTGTPMEDERVLLFFSRLHPKKNVEALLASWSRLQDRFPEWRLEIAGGGPRSYVKELEQTVRQADLRRVRFVGARHGADKAAMFEAADLFVLPTLSENFGIVIAEALSYGTPVVTTNAAPWSGLQSTDSGWWIELGEEPLFRALRDAMSLDRAELSAMGTLGRSWIASEFSWATVGAMVATTYEWVSGGGPIPAWVQT